MPALKTIAVVESTPRFTHIIQPAIDQALGKTVHLNSASALLADLNHSICLVDLMLEDTDALTLIEDIRLKGGKMPIVAVMDSRSLSELEMEECSLRKMALDAGANALFIAPFNLAELMQALQRMSLTAVAQTSANEPLANPSAVA